jgi:hypothetical protein
VPDDGFSYEPKHVAVNPIYIYIYREREREREREGEREKVVIGG